MPKMMNAMAVVRNQANSPTAVEKKAQVGRKADAEKTRHEWKDASLDSFDRDKNGKISWAEYLAARRGGATNDSDDDDFADQVLMPSKSNGPFGAAKVSKKRAAARDIRDQLSDSSRQQIRKPAAAAVALEAAAAAVASLKSILNY